MNKVSIVISILLAASMLLIGCTQPYTPTTTLPPTTTASPTNGQPPEDMTWISPGKVMVGNFHPGARAEWYLTVHNGNNFAAQFSITYRYPDHVGTDKGYTFPTSVVQDWIIVADPTPVLMPRETRDILIILQMPSTLVNEQVQFWQITSTGLEHLDTIKETAYAMFEEEALKQADPEVRDRMLAEIPDKVLQGMLAVPKTNLLMYLRDVRTVSLEDFTRKRPNDATLIVDTVSEKYISLGDLRTDNWEFWISVIDTTQTGMVTTELCLRWLVTMRS